MKKLFCFVAVYLLPVTLGFVLGAFITDIYWSKHNSGVVNACKQYTDYLHQAYGNALGAERQRGDNFRYPNNTQRFDL